METLLRRRHAHAGTARRRTAHRPRWPASCFRSLCTSGLHAIGIQPLLDAIVSYVPRLQSATSPPWTPRAANRGEGVGCRALCRVRVEDDCRSVCRPHHDAPGRHRNAQVGRHGAQPDARRVRAAGAPAGAAGQDTDARPGAEGRRPRRGRQAEGHPHERRPRRQVDEAQLPADHVPRAGARLRHRAEEPRRRGQDQQRHAAAARKKTRASATRAIRRPTSCCCRDRGSCTSRSRSRS